VKIAPGDYMVADDTGAIVVPANILAEVTELAEEREEVDQETMSQIEAGETLAATHRHFRDDDTDWYRRVE
jgi:regulator of RNase E activity RraA